MAKEKNKKCRQFCLHFLFQINSFPVFNLCTHTKFGKTFSIYNRFRLILTSFLPLYRRAFQNTRYSITELDIRKPFGVSHTLSPSDSA